ncbi:hypothetical protein [Candidiatus Paracoxiella cheracis]|uniref:hypothetical protein n=1 Tax=Candidiatus Paracoxiella cheracis TaxID=3405120 RepID=UPI003BF5498F
MKKSTLLSLTTGLVAVSFSFSAFAESCSVGVACGGNNSYKYYKAQPRTIDMSGFKKGEWVRCVTTDAVDAKNIALGITGAQPSGVKFRYMPSDSGTFASKKGAPY